MSELNSMSDQNTIIWNSILGIDQEEFVSKLDKNDNTVQEYENRIVDRIPRLIQMCGRTENSVKFFFESLLENPNRITRTLLSLINHISKTSPFETNNDCEAMTSRGFAVIEALDQNMSEIKDFNIKEVSENNRQIWFVLSGMGSQYKAMAKDLIQIEFFEKSIRNSCEIMRKYSIDLWSLLTDDSKDICDSVMNSFLTIASIQMALIDLLEELDIRPNGIIGHSIGELVCAYADRCLSAEQILGMAYWRAKCIEDNPKTRGRMIAIRLGAEEAKAICPSNAFIACINSEDSVTISGNNRAIDKFVKTLKEFNVFTADVESSGIAFHSKQMFLIREELTEKLKLVMNDKLIAPSLWIQTTSNYYNANSNRTQTLSAQYFADNLLYPVQFDEALKQMPKNAIVVEISPHCLFRSLIKRSLGPNISYIPLMRKKENNLKQLHSSVGTLYSLGLNPNIEKLYSNAE